jgi:putative MATE family efflux protein
MLLSARPPADKILPGTGGRQGIYYQNVVIAQNMAILKKISSASTSERTELILNGNPVTTIFKLSVPTMMMGTIQALLPLIDGLFINNIIGTNAASAITYCTPIVMMLTALAQGLSVAGMAMIGQMNGRRDIDGARHVATQIIVATVAISLIIAPLLAVLSVPISANVNKDISHDVFVYLSLSSLIQPFFFMSFVYNAIKNAQGKPEAPFIRMILLTILKVIFNFLFIQIMLLGIPGAILSSLISNIIICGWMYYELFIMPSEDKLTLRGFRFDAAVVRQMFKIGVPSMLSTVMLNLGFLLINNEVAKYGSATLNGQGIAGNITSICFTLPSSFGTSVTTMVSMNVGAGRVDNAKKACLVGCIVSAITAAVTIAVVVPLSPYLTVLFTRRADVLFIANKALHIYTYSVIGFGICMVELGAFIGLGRTMVPLIINILRVWALRYVFILATESFLGVYAVFWGNLFSNYAAAVITTVLLLRITWTSAISTSGPPSPPQNENAQETPCS